ncbi:hypothetical protein CEW91_09770 [Idiomarina piscisalsi]|uniref:Cadherin domain-containing protein n=1 Tax=Idiomarina piscisalsi TaxID=1096243 RepID=A0ABN5AR61_9GAMM|nr:Ig-like domain-containing protein [Idiomarina piscisalsi]ASG66406.1 hypothetical protein CEW91_09770 [Idiomarina piscisalsi]
MDFKVSMISRSLIIAGVASSLIACGGSSETNEAPVAGAVSAEADVSQEQTTVNLLASSTDPNGDALTVTEVGSAEFGTVSLDGNTAVYTPESTSNFGEDSFTFTISDGELTSEATATIDLVGTLSIQGQVIDSPIANATVSIIVNGEEYTVQADENGFYELPAKFSSLDSNQVVRITARGSEEFNQGNVTLSSMLTSIGKLLERAGDDFTLSRSDINDVNVTHVTTARDVLTRKAAGDQEVTADNIAEFGNAIDPQLLIQMAAVTKLIVDNDSFELPEGYETIEEFLNDDNSYNEFVETASAGGDSSPLNQAIEETLEDPDVMPELRMEDLYGTYMQIRRAPEFLKPDAAATWKISENGISQSQVVEAESPVVSFSLNGNKLVPDTENAKLSGSVNFAFLSEDAFEDRPEAKDAWVAYNGWSSFRPTQVQVTVQTDLVESSVISQSESELVLRNTTVYKQSAVTFEFEGQQYVAKPATESQSQNDIRLVKVDEFMQSELTFNVSEQSEWLLPPVKSSFSTLELVAYKLSADNSYAMQQSDIYLEQHSYTEQDVAGTWQLSEDKRHLTLTPTSGDYSIRLTRHRNDPDYKSVVTEYLYEGESKVTKLLYGMPTPQAPDFSVVDMVTESDLLFNSIVNYRDAVFWSDSDTLRVKEFMFDFNADGTGQQLSGLCKGELLSFGTVCSEPMQAAPDSIQEMTWELGGDAVFDELFIFNRNAQIETSDSMRYWLPLGFSDKDILSVLEWNVWTYYDTDGTPNGNSYILPRFNHYQLAERPEVYDPNATGTSSMTKTLFSEVESQTSSNLGYIIINPQVSPETQRKH